jgi:hypothetical protein
MASMSRSLLTKSRYMNGLQCPKLLWVSVNGQDRIPRPDASTQNMFDEGRKVGELARRCFPGGIDLTNDNFMANIRLTKQSLALRRPLFEAGFLIGRLYCRVDILRPNGSGTWDIIEVKSSTSVKSGEHLPDVAFQRHTCNLAGVKIAHCYIMHINKEFTRDGEIDPDDFFSLEDVTGDIADCAAGIDARVDGMLAYLDGDEPGAEIGRRCETPRACVLMDECWAAMPAHHVMTLYWGGALGEKLLRRGILSIAGIPAGEPLNGKQKIQRECVISGKHHCDRAELRGFLKQLAYPLHFLDFETFRLAVPIYDGTRPYQQITFQFSLDVCEHDGDGGTHYGYLADGPADPRPGLLRELKRHISPTGSVVAYNKSFEEERLAECALAFPAEKDWIESALTRLLDLMAPFKGFLYYHPEQYGSYSLKKVLPALTGMSYEGLEIGDGDTASLRYLAMCFNGVSEAERQKIRADLETYCGQDTRGMIAVLAKLREMA